MRLITKVKATTNTAGLAITSTITPGSGTSSTQAVPVGDVNNDGFPDLIITSFQQALATLVLGRSASLENSWYTNNGGPSTGIISFTGSSDSSMTFGYSASALGDVNGDDYDDFLISAPKPTPGVTYLIFGKKEWTANVVMTSFQSGVDGYKITNANSPNSGSGYFGYSVGQIGDLNKDGKPDFAIASFRERITYVLWGRTWTDNIDVSSMDPTTVGIKITDTTSGFCQPAGVGAAGDVNDDGIDDMYITCFYDDTNSFIIFGKQGLNANIELSSLASKGAKINGLKMYDGTGGKDLNGDGIADVAFSQIHLSPASVFVLFGQKTFSSADLSTPISGTKGITFSNTYAARINMVEDFNGDGYSDLALATNTQTPTIIFGGKWTASTGSVVADCSDPLICITGSAGNGLSTTYAKVTLTDLNNDGMKELYFADAKVFQFKAGYYSSASENKVCSSAYCFSCSGATSCTKCTSGRSADGSGYCCAPGLVGTDSTTCKTCSDAIPFCTACTSSTACTACSGGRTGAKCDCPTDKYDSGSSCVACSTINTGCTACSDKDTCTACADASATASGKNCNCPTGRYLSGSMCTACSSLNPACTACSNANTCTSCSAGSPSGSQCVCPTGEYLDGATCKTCSSAITNCAECSSGSVCTKCDASFYLYASACVSSCPAGTQKSGGSCIRSPEKREAHSKKYSAGILAAMIIGGIVGVTVIVITLVFLFRRSLRKRATIRAQKVKVANKPDSQPNLQTPEALVVNDA